MNVCLYLMCVLKVRACTAASSASTIPLPESDKYTAKYPRHERVVGVHEGIGKGKAMGRQGEGNGKARGWQWAGQEANVSE
jgi:hypothetical protein